MNEIDERQRRFVEYINDHLQEDPIKIGDVDFWYWKSIVRTKDADLYHRIAQSLGIEHLDFGSELFFLYRVPNDGGGLGDAWNVHYQGNGDDFLERFPMYTVHRI